MDRRRFLLTSLAGTLAVPVAVEAQPTAKMHTVGFVSLGGDPLWWQPVLEALREVGYIEGQNLAVKRAFAKGRPEDLDRLVMDIARSGIDIAVTTATRETRAVQQATPNTPIVMLLVADPVGDGFVKTLARPGGNVTGLTSVATGLAQKIRRTASTGGTECIAVYGSGRWRSAAGDPKRT